MIEHRSQHNKLSEMLDNYPEGYPCFMWWPRTKMLTPVKSMALCPQNAKLLQVEYYRPKASVEIQAD